jgi:hypothetical protein
MDPWEEWLAIHAGELLPDGRPRFRIVLVLVARQNGKTEVLVILTLYWQFVDSFPLILGTSTKLEYAKESWQKSVKLAEATPDFAELRGPRRWTRDTNGEQQSTTTEDARYKIAASNEEGGRSLTINRLVCDELRQHHDYSAWGAAEEATSAVWDAQIWALSNAGDARSVVLNDLRAEALRYIETGDGDQRLGLFEWSSPEGADPRDIHALAMANPNLGRRKDGEVLLAKAHRAVRIGGEALASFKTESMCITVPMLDPAVDSGAWGRGHVPGTLAAVRSRVALVVDIAPDEMHASLVAAAVLPDDRVRVEAIKAWEGVGCVDAMRRDLPALVARIRPQAIGWLPVGPAAVLGADLKPREGRKSTLPVSVTVEEIRGELAAVCMGLAEQVTAGRVVHSDDPLINAHVLGAEKLKRGDTWVFSRRGGGHCDAAYATAGAVHLARTLPTAVGKPRLVIAPD